MKRTLLVPLTALALALGAIGALPQRAHAETSVEDFKKDCDTNSIVVEGLDPATGDVKEVSCKQDRKWNTCDTNKNAGNTETTPPEYTDQCSVIYQSNSSGRIGSSTRPAPGSRVPGLSLPQPNPPARPLPGLLPRPAVR